MESSEILEKDVDVVRQDLIRTIQRHPAAMGNSAVALCALLELAGLSQFVAFTQGKLLRLCSGDQRSSPQTGLGLSRRGSALGGSDAGRRLGRQLDLELIEDGLNVFVRLRVPRHDQPPAIEHRDPDLDHLDGGELFQDRRRRQSRGMDHQPVLQRDLQAISEERNQNMSVGPVLELMVDRPDSQFALQRPEHRLDLRQLHIARPQYSRIFAGEIGPEQIMPIPLLGALQLRSCPPETRTSRA